MIAFRFLEQFFTERYIKKHNGVFEPEARLPVCYIGSLLMFAGQLYVILHTQRRVWKLM